MSPLRDQALRLQITKFDVIGAAAADSAMVDS